MSADPRGTGSTTENRRWYLEVSGRRAGPFAWSVIIELAQAGALGADDRVWHMGLSSWSRVGDVPDLAALIHEPAPSGRRLQSTAPHDPTAGSKKRRVFMPWLVAGITGLGLAVSWLAVSFYIARDNFSPSGESLAAFAPRASAFEARYPFLAELRRVDPPRFQQLDRAVRVGLRRSAPETELDGYVAESTRGVERERLNEVSDSDVLRFALDLRTTARTFRSSDPAQCAAILGPQSAAIPVRSAAALTAIAPALASLLAAPMTSRAASKADLATLQQAKETVAQTLAAARSDADVDPKVACDRLLLMYDGAVAQTPDVGAAQVRAILGH